MSSDIDRVLNELLEKVKPPEFPPGGVPTEIAARVYGIAPDTLRNQMEQGMIGIGHITRKKKRGQRQIYISPLKLYKDTGFIWRGEKKVEELEERK